jgi:SAM-dependent methyltransferase
MDDYGPGTYGDRVASVYDEWYAELPFGGELATTVSFLRQLAADGSALELGIGTGRVALPLRQAGVDVHGIDASDAMVQRLRTKPGGADIPVTLGDFRDFSLGKRFRVVYVVFNTFFGLLSQDDQVSCMRAVARHLEDDGVFVMEAFVPDPARFDRGQRVSAIRVESDAVALEVSKHDPLAQRTDSQHVVLGPDGVRLYPVKIRYSHVSELDLMAKLAGMQLRERWSDWDRTTLSSESPKHVSVWEMAESPNSS